MQLSAFTFFTAEPWNAVWSNWPTWGRPLGARTKWIPRYHEIYGVILREVHMNRDGERGGSKKQDQSASSLGIAGDHGAAQAEYVRFRNRTTAFSPTARDLHPCPIGIALLFTISHGRRRKEEIPGCAGRGMVNGRRLTGESSAPRGSIMRPERAIPCRSTIHREARRSTTEQ
jgi:hypothetical protein